MIERLHPTAPDSPPGAPPMRPRVGIVVNLYNQAGFLADALRSCLDQTWPAAEVLVVDDGSTDDVGTVMREFPQVRYIRQDNAGLAAARNAGTSALETELVIFLDADDRLTRIAVEAGTECILTHPGAWMVYGAHRLIDAGGEPTSPAWRRQMGPDPFLALLADGNIIAMHATTIYRRARLIEAGGFDPVLACCEDYDLFLRIAQHGVIAGHDELVAEYRHHGANMSGNSEMMLATAEAVLARRAPGATPAIRRAIGHGRATMGRHYCPPVAVEYLRRMVRGGDLFADAKKVTSFAMRSPTAFIRYLARGVARRTVRALPAPIGRCLGAAPRVGLVNFGDFDRTRPIGTVFGFDRGQPVDRHYIDLFLSSHRDLIRGRVLEIGDDSYTRQFGGGAVTRRDILHVHGGNPAATLVGDLSNPDTLPQGAFDCIILTQTLHLIYDMPQALGNLYSALAPGGTLLVTVPGISPVEPWEWQSTWYWSLTTVALERLLLGNFGRAEVEVGAYGNVYSAIGFLAGLATAELDPVKLRHSDVSFPVLVHGRATRSAS